MIQQATTDGAMARGRTEGPRAGFVLQGRLASLKGQNILFSSAERAIFTVNDTAADIWRCLAEGAPPEAISSQIGETGVDRAEATRLVEAALRDWERLNLIRPFAPSALASFDPYASQVIAVAGIHVHILYPRRVAFPAMALFRHLEARTETVDAQLHVAEGRDEDRLHLFRNGEWIASCSSDELHTVLKGQLLGEVLSHGAYELALHAAALVRGDRLLLLCGEPGAGKTTLTLALLDSGFGFAADDVTLLESSGLAVGLPFAAAVKAGALPLLRGRGCDPNTAPVFRRPDGRRVRYAVPKALTPAVLSPRTVGWVVLLRRGRKATAGLEPVDPSDALRGLLNGAFAPSGQLSREAFELLARVIGSAETYGLTYSRLEDAVELIDKACQ